MSNEAESLYEIVNHFDSMRRGLPEDWQDFADELSRDLRGLVERLRCEAAQPVAWRTWDTNNDCWSFTRYPHPRDVGPVWEPLYTRTSEQPKET